MKDNINKNSEALETIEDNSTLESVYEHHKYLQSKGNFSFLVLGVFYLFIAVISIVDMATLATAISLGTACCWFLFRIINNASIKKFSMQAFEKQKDCKCRFMVYCDHIEYIVTKDGQCEKFLYIHPDKIEKVTELKNSYVFQYDIISFSVLKDNVNKDGAFYNMLFKYGDAEICKKAKEMLIERMSEVLVLLSSFLMLFHITIGKNFCPWWFPFAYMLAPVVAFSLLVVQKTRKCKVPVLRMYVSVGMAFLMFVFGMAAKPRSEVEGPSDEYNAVISEIAAVCDIELPFANEIYAETFKRYDDSSQTFIEAMVYTLYLDEKQILEFCNSIEKNDKWIGSVTEELDEFFGEFAYLYPGDVLSVYNVTEKTYNCLPVSDEKCEYIVLYFDSAYSYIEVTTFTK